MNQNITWVFVVFTLIALSPTIVSAEEIIITPVAGSKLPGCEETEQGCYNPKYIKVEIGTVITFQNTDVSAHTFTSDKFDTALMINDGETKQWVVERGITEYTCLLHPWAVGTIVGVSIPPLDSITEYPKWILNLYYWYYDGLIDYDTFMNALNYILDKGIAKQVE